MSGIKRQTTRILSDAQRLKEDESDDSIFYSIPRFCHHLDEAFRGRLTNLYREKIAPDSVVLDLMSSWVSHLPREIKYKKVYGHGLNHEELNGNERLDEFWVQDLNRKQKLPLEDSSIDICLIVAGWQYLQYPESVACELKRIIKPGGQLLVSFSNRAFWTKSPRIWKEGNDLDHINYIKAVLLAQGWLNPQHIAERTVSSGFLRMFAGEGDPFYSVIAIT